MLGWGASPVRSLIASIATRDRITFFSCPFALFARKLLIFLRRVLHLLLEGLSWQVLRNTSARKPSCFLVARELLRILTWWKHHGLLVNALYKRVKDNISCCYSPRKTSQARKGLNSQSGTCSLQPGDLRVKRLKFVSLITLLSREKEVNLTKHQKKGQFLSENLKCLLTPGVEETESTSQVSVIGNGCTKNERRKG